MKTFNNDLDDEEMKISLDVMCELHYKNSLICLREKENIDNKPFTKHVLRQNHFLIVKFRILKSLQKSH